MDNQPKNISNAVTIEAIRKVFATLLASYKEVVSLCDNSGYDIYEDPLVKEAERLVTSEGFGKNQKKMESALRIARLVVKGKDVPQSLIDQYKTNADA